MSHSENEFHICGQTFEQAIAKFGPNLHSAEVCVARYGWDLACRVLGEALLPSPAYRGANECACFPGTCRGGQVVDGKLPNGQRCKACIPAK